MFTDTFSCLISRIDRCVTTMSGLFVLLGVLASLLLWSAWQHSPTHAEVQQLPAGIYHLQNGRFDFAHVNPPLVRLVAAIPVSFLSPKTNWLSYQANKIGRVEYSVGSDFVDANGERSRLIFFIGRCACIPFALLGAIFCWKWGRFLYGAYAGFVAALLWSFSPSVLGHGQLISADIACAALCLAAMYFIMKWIYSRTWSSALIAAVILGMAQLTKFTALVLIPVVIIWCGVEVGRRISTRNDQSLLSVIGQPFLQLCVIFVIMIYIIDLGYGFDGVPVRLSEQVYFSKTFNPFAVNRVESEHNSTLLVDNSLWGRIPIPLPASYIRGIDQQKVDFEGNARSYLFGVWQHDGWWYYYIVALLIKMPLGLTGLFALSVLTCIWIRRPCSACFSKICVSELASIGVIVAVLILVSSQTSMNHHMRYVFPMLGFFLVFCSRSALFISKGRFAGSTAVVILSLWATISSLIYYPHGLGYFNELAGGPGRGALFLNHSNVDWGQDLLYLKRWIAMHPDCCPLMVSTDTLYNPASLGIDYIKPPKIMLEDNTERSKSEGPIPGWYAISTNNLYMSWLGYGYLLDQSPVARVGYSINIYHLSIDDANRIRRDHQLRELPSDWESRKQAWDGIKERIIHSLKAGVRRNNQSETPVRVAILHMTEADGGTDDPDKSESVALKRMIEEKLECECVLIPCSEIKIGALSQYDLLFVPGGSSRLMAQALGSSGKEKVREFIQKGGGYVGICAGAFLATDRFENSLDIVDAKPLVEDVDIPEMGKISMAERGIGTVMVSVNDAGREIFGDLGGLLSASYTGGPVFSKNSDRWFPECITLAEYRNEIWKYVPQRGTMVQTPAIITFEFGKGRAILFGFHPEISEGGKTFVVRAIQAVTGSKDQPNKPVSAP